MTEPRDHEQYETPAIEEREKIDTPLVAALVSEEPTSAAFHPAEHDDGYEAPGIETREPIDTALIGAVGSGEQQISAAFHPADEYEPPAIVERDEIDTPLVAFGSGVVCAATH